MQHNPNSVADYISNLKRQIVDKFGIEYMKMDDTWVNKNYKIKCDAKSILEREFNQAIAFKLKDSIDNEDQFGTIDIIRNCIASGYDPDTTNLKYYDSYTKMDFDKLDGNSINGTGQRIKALLG
jgi:hypothetical protein